MRAAALAVWLAASAAAQSPMPYERKTEPEAPAASTQTAPSPAAPAKDEESGRGVKVAGDEPKKKLARPMHAVIHADAKDWEPIGLRVGGVPGSGSNSVALKVVKVKGRMKGENSKAAAVARLHDGRKESTWLVISLYPDSLASKRAHFEVRLRVFEGFVENVQVAAITVTERRRKPSSKRLDAYELRSEGIEYQEDRPGSGRVLVSALDPRPGRRSLNSGRLEKAEFSKALGFVNLSWSLRGVTSSKK